MTKQEVIDLKERIGQRFTELMNTVKLDRKQIAKAVNAKPTAVEFWQNGGRTPKLKYWRDILKVLKCYSLDSLFKPVIDEIKKDTELDKLMNIIKTIYKNVEAKNELYVYLEIIYKHHDIMKKSTKIPSFKEGDAKRQTNV